MKIVAAVIALAVLTACAHREPLQGNRHGIVYTVSDGKTVSSTVVIK